MTMAYGEYFQGAETIDGGGDEDQNGACTINGPSFYLVICPGYVFSLKIAHSGCSGDRRGSSNSGGEEGEKRARL